MPEHANQWASHVFKVEENPDGSFTYWGATGDFLLGDAGRNAIDIYKVTLPPPPKPRWRAAARHADVPARATPAHVRRRRGSTPSSARPRKKRKRVRFSFGRAGRIV